VKNSPVELMNYDRLIFGTQCVFLVQILNGEVRRMKKDNEEREIKLEDIDYEYAILEQKENYLTGGGGNKVKKIDKVEEEEMRKKVINEIEEEFIKMKEINEEENKKKLEEQEIKFREKMEKI
jgi:hypothetical protein